MIACPPGWFKESLQGGCILRSPLLPSGEHAAELRYSEAVGPVLSAAAVVKKILSYQPDFVVSAQSRPELFITAEGEYAALVRVSGRLGARPLWHLVAAVYGEATMNVLDAMVGDPAELPAIAHTVRALVYADRLGLGVRKRRFFYQPPAGWQPLCTGLLCSYYPPDYPRQRAALVAHPAMPRDSSVDGVANTFVKVYQQRGFVVEALTQGEPVTADWGLHGKAFCLVGSFPSRPGLTCDLLVLADNRYLYTLILESDATARRAELQGILPAVARSVRPIPLAAGPVDPGSPSSLNSWSF